ncbi:hypothetical protein PGT21_005821 [Puccinia graminis f. sp. tritici]|uniref:Mid2 domain-containing protein n=1 Tax=Puccinia graminis f. sp. tritici TaxID=56615 RepID=A0A5B0QNA2_PUCGR|nr:hypothetical protein PGT21_005821 [Puccinia graminis f. sp. tritici]
MNQIKGLLNLLLHALLLLSLTTKPINSQAINPASPASPVAPAPAAAPTSPAAAPPPPPSEPSQSTPPELAAPTSTNPAPASPTNSPTSASNPSSSSALPANSQSNPPAPQSSASSASAHSAASSSSPASLTISGAASQPASSIVIVTVTRTGADGQVYTSVTSTYTPLPKASSTPNNNSSAGGNSSNTWAIIGGIVGGLAGIGAVVFIVFRCTQRRFSDLDDEDVAIKWPELVNRAEDPSTLNPLAARPGVGHGIGEDDEHADEKPRLYSHDIAMESLHSDQRHPGMYDTYQAYPPPPPLHPQEHNGYSDDPYLGPSGIQPPYPGTVSNLGYDEQPGYQHRPHDLHSQPSLSSSIANTRDQTTSPRPDSRQHNHLNLPDHHLQYPIAWDGPEDIPLTVVNNQPNQNPPLHNPYHQS